MLRPAARFASRALTFLLITAPSPNVRGAPDDAASQSPALPRGCGAPASKSTRTRPLLPGLAGQRTPSNLDRGFDGASYRSELLARYAALFCTTPHAQDLLPTVCGAARSKTREFAAALFEDAALLPHRALFVDATLQPTPQRVLAASLFASLGGEVGVCGYGDLLAGVVPAPSSAHLACQVAAAPPVTPLARAGHLIQDLAGLQQRSTQPEPQLTPVERNALSKRYPSLRTGTPLDTAYRAVTNARAGFEALSLVDESLWSDPDACLGSLLNTLAPALLDLTNSALLALGEVGASAEVTAFDPHELISVLLTLRLDAWLEHGEALLAPYPETRDAVEALKTSYEIASARKPADALRLLSGVWPSGWIVDLNLGAARVRSGNFRFTGDAALGYSRDALGLVLHGGLNAYDLSGDGRIDDSTRAFVDGDAWLNSDPTYPSRTRVEARLSAGFAAYDSTQYFTDATDRANGFLSETSLVARGRLLIGVRTQPTDSLALGLWLGGGYEGEFYDQFNALEDDGTTTFNDHFAGSALGEGRFRLQYVLVGPLVVRVHANALWHRISRATSSLVIGGAAPEFIDSPIEHADQFEVTSRVHLDLETSWLAGFVPSLASGLDYFLIHTSAGTVARPIPVFTAGVRRIAF